MGPAIEHSVLEFLRERGANELPHPSGSLLAHLKRTRDRLRSWGADDALQLAGLCHAAYGTEGFPPVLLPLDRRGELQRLIGDHAEALVYAYCSADRAYGLSGSGGQRDRFGGHCWTPSRALSRALAELSVANELDVLAVAAISDEQRAAIHALLRGLWPLLSLAASHAVAAVLAAQPPARIWSATPLARSACWWLRLWHRSDFPP